MRRKCTPEKLRTARIRYAKMCEYSNRDSNSPYPCCAICGYSGIKALSFDHIYNDGAEDRKRMKLNGTTVRKQIYSGPMRTDIQVLCFNCQQEKDECLVVIPVEILVGEEVQTAPNQYTKRGRE